MFEWPQIDEPELLGRLAMDDRDFEKFIVELMAAIPSRAYDAAALAQAVSYPWWRPPGPYLLSASGVEPLEAMSEAQTQQLIERFASAASGRSPLLAIGSNAAPEALRRKFAHLIDEDDRTALAMTGWLHDFDVGASAHLTPYGVMPATLLPSPGTAVRATVLWVTPRQLTQLAWSELNYRLGRLRARFVADQGVFGFDETLAFTSRFGTFCIDGEPVALAAVPARGRKVAGFTQEQLLDTAATLVLGPGANAKSLIRAVFEEMHEVAPKIAASVCRASQPLTSERWTPFSPTARPAGARSRRGPA